MDLTERIMETKTAKYTPGPWRAIGERNWNEPRVSAIDPDTGRYSLVATVAWREGEHNANARLIAAAPQLYEALRALVEHVNPEGGSDEVAIQDARMVLSTVEV